METGNKEDARNGGEGGEGGSNIGLMEKLKFIYNGMTIPWNDKKK